MTGLAFDAVLRKGKQRAWSTEALSLPGAKVLGVHDDHGTEVQYDLHDGTIAAVAPTGGPLIARIELSEEVVAASKIEETKLDLDRQRLLSDERASRRTILVSLATAVLSAAATVAVAAITHKGDVSKPGSPTYKELRECRESVERLVTLSNLDTQTIPNLRLAIRQHADACVDRLKAAEGAASQP